MRTTVTKTIFFALFFAMLFSKTSSWWDRRRRRRRRRSSPPPDPCAGSKDCTVSSWSGWSSCSWPCGLSGVKRRSRSVINQAVNCGSCPHSLSEKVSCNTDSSLCLHESTPANDGCSCRSGWTGTCCGDGKSRS